MIPAPDFVAALRKAGYRAFAGVPCSYLTGVLAALEDSDEYTAAPHEGIALAMSVGHELAGTASAIFLQNSGVGNLLDPLTSLVMSYEVPALLFVSMRGRPAEDDEPHHAVMGRSTAAVFEAIGIETALLTGAPDELDGVLARALTLRGKRRPFVVLTTKTTFGGAPRGPAAADRAFTAQQVVRRILREPGSPVLVSTTGMISRELYAQGDRDRCFYMQGSMGHAISIGVGYARSDPRSRVVVLDGDGSVLMHLGASALAAGLAPPNLVHVVLDNAAYDSTGGQRAPRTALDWDVMGSSLGYRSCRTCPDEQALNAALDATRSARGPHLIMAPVGRHRPGLPRVSEQWTNPEIFSRARAAV